MDVNTASLEALTKVVGVKRAYDLVLWRPFLNWAEVAETPGLDGEALAALRAAGCRVKLPGDPRTYRDQRNLPG